MKRSAWKSGNFVESVKYRRTCGIDQLKIKRDPSKNTSIIQTTVSSYEEVPRKHQMRITAAETNEVGICNEGQHKNSWSI